MKRRDFNKLVAASWGAVALLPSLVWSATEKAASAVASKIRPAGFRSKNTLNGNMGTDPMWNMSTQTCARPTAANPGESQPMMALTAQEQAIMDGKQGLAMQKAMKTIVAYGELFGAKRLVDLDHAPHIAMSWGTDVVVPFLDIYQQFADEGIKTYAPFTSDPKPFDFERLDPGPEKTKITQQAYRQDGRLTELYEKLGMVKGGWTCVCYAPEVGNIPKLGDMLSWSESSAINYSNSAIGARTNRNTMGIDMLSALLGKAPEFGLMTDEGRKANWLIEVKNMPRLPHPEMVGSAIGLKIIEDVPYIVGMDEMVNALPEQDRIGYLKDLGAATASNGAVGLYHMEGVTPEARQHGRKLLADNYQTYTIDWNELKRIYDAYPIRWPEGLKNNSPERVFIGCPVNTKGQLEYYGQKIIDELDKAGKQSVAVPTYMFAHEKVTDHFIEDNRELAGKLEKVGVSFPRNCPMMYLTTPKQSEELVVTNSNKTRVYSTARFFPDFELMQVIVTGVMPETVTGGVKLSSHDGVAIDDVIAIG
jgi:predicted aconitase